MRKNKKKSKNKKILIGIGIGLAALVYLLPFIIITGSITYSMLNKTEYEEKDNQIIVNKNQIIINDISSYYSNDTEEYIISGYIDNSKKDYSISITFDVYDENNYIIGQAYANLEMKKGSSYKFKAVYFGDDATEVVKYKLNDIELY